MNHWFSAHWLQFFCFFLCLSFFLRLHLLFFHNIVGVFFELGDRRLLLLLSFEKITHVVYFDSSVFSFLAMQVEKLLTRVETLRVYRNVKGINLLKI